MTEFLSSSTLSYTTKLHKFYEHCVEIETAGQQEKEGLKLKKGKQLGLLKKFYPSINFLCENTAEIRDMSINSRVVSSSRVK